MAGAFLNFLAGFLIFFLLYLPTESYTTPVIDRFMDDFTGGGVGGLQAGDEVLSVDGYRILFPQDITTALSRGDDTLYDIVVRRDGQRIRLTDVPIEKKPYESDGETVWYYGFYFTAETSNLFTPFRIAWRSCLSVVRLVVESLQMIVRGQVTLNDFSGPVGITAVMSDVAKQSMSGFWYLAGLIAVNLAVMQLLPIPALDGGRLLFLGLECIFRRKFSRRIEAYVNTVIFLLLMGFMLMVTFNDVWKLIR